MEPSSHDHTEHAPGAQPWWRSPANLVLAGFLLVGAFFLITEHTAHVLGALPWLLLLACPLMHLFMHHEHGGHGAHHDHGKDEKPDADGGRSA
jgi:hypothetical protein